MEHDNFWLLVVIYFGIQDHSTSNIKPKDKASIPILERTEMRMVRWMCSAEMRERTGIELVSDAVKWIRLTWLGHVLQKDDNKVKNIMSFEVEDKRRWGKLGMTWSQVVEREDTKNKERWRRLLCRTAGQPLYS